MSAFVVSDETMHRVVDAVRTHPKSKIAKMLPADPQAIGQALFEMNQDAVRQRYPDDPEMVDMDPYRWQSRPATAVEHVKAIACLSYQCCEGDVPDRGLYKALDHLGELIADEIINNLDSERRTVATLAARRNYRDEQQLRSSWVVSHLSEYDRAPWDWN